jgi:hypothetical protein
MESVKLNREFDTWIYVGKEKVDKLSLKFVVYSNFLDKKFMYIRIYVKSLPLRVVAVIIALQQKDRIPSRLFAYTWKGLLNRSDSKSTE